MTLDRFRRFLLVVAVFLGVILAGGALGFALGVIINNQYR